MSAVVNRDITSIISQSYAELGRLSLEAGRNERNGFDTSKAQEEIIRKGVFVRYLLKVVLDHTSFNDAGNFQYLLRCTPEEMNTFLMCLVKATDIQDYPVAPLLFHKLKPRVINQGNTGNVGPQGPPGDNAAFNVVPDDGEDQIFVTPELISGVQTFKLKFDPYVAPLMTASIPGQKVFEVGNIADNVQINIVTTKGRNTISSIVSSYLNSAFQSILNLAGVNGLTQPFTTAFTISGITTNLTVNFTLQDNSGNAAGTLVRSVSISFYYPFLYGQSISNDVSGASAYDDFSKILSPKADQLINLNGTDKYFWIGYPAEFGPASQILDNNLFDVTSSFTFITKTVNKGGPGGWSVSYIFYRTTLRTTIIDKNYTLKF